MQPREDSILAGGPLMLIESCQSKYGRRNLVVEIRLLRSHLQKQAGAPKAGTMVKRIASGSGSTDGRPKILSQCLPGVGLPVTSHLFRRSLGHHPAAFFSALRPKV
jgi:hypothetical protein